MPKQSRKRVQSRKSRKSGKQQRKSYKRQSHGGSYSMGPGSISAGNLVVGRNLIGPDCLSAQRPGQVSDLIRSGLPGMSGGRYGISLDGAPMFGLGGVSSIPCEGSRPNSLNLRGGGQGADMMTYEAQNAGYQNNVMSVGGRPLMIQTPYAQQAMNPACLRTAGGSRKRRTMRKMKHKKRKASKRN